MSQSAIPSHSSVVLADPASFRLAGRCLRWATATLAVAGVSIGLFFGGAGAIFGPINDLTTAATLVLIIPGALAARQLARGRIGAWFSALTLVTVGGLGVAAGSLVALVAGLITLNDSFLIGGIAVLPFLTWLAALAYAAILRDLLRSRVGWAAAATLAVALVATAASPFLPMSLLTFVLGLPLFAAFAAWLWLFGTELIET